MTKRILIVDDEEIVIRSCRRILEGHPYEIDVARNGFPPISRGWKVKA